MLSLRQHVRLQPLKEMENVMGNTGNLALEDQKRLEDIHRRLGLVDDVREQDNLNEKF